MLISTLDFEQESGGPGFFRPETGRQRRAKCPR
jgi:hypothetical protein